MKKGNLLKYVLAFALVAPLASTASPVDAASKFSGKEDEYYTLCSSKSLSKFDIKANS